MMKCTGFLPIADHTAKVLILGTMPGAQSLQRQQYYAHPRNSFWQILCTLFAVEHQTLDYDRRQQLLLNHHVALWDVLKHCDRQGSLDVSIDRATFVPNDFKDFFLKHTHIKIVLFNGKAAATLFRQQVLTTLKNTHSHLLYQQLPSTSPAHAAMTVAQKLAQWQVVLEYVE